SARDTESLEQLPLEAELRCPDGEIGAHAARLEGAFDRAVAALAAVFEAEQVAQADRVAADAPDLSDLLHAADAVAHALGMYDKVNGAADLHADRAQGQVQIGHHDHVLEAVERVPRRIRMDGRHRTVMAGVHRLQHVEGFGAANLADDDTVRARAQRVAHELALRHRADAFDIGRAGLHLHDMRLLQPQFDRVLDRDDA